MKPILRFLLVAIFLAAWAGTAWASDPITAPPPKAAPPAGLPKADVEAKPFTWTVKSPPPKLVLLWNRETSLVITAGERAAHNVRIVQSTLQEATTGALLGPESLTLCVGHQCGVPITIEARATARLAVAVAPQFNLPGNFTGGIALTADERGGVDTVELTVLSTSWYRWFWGAALIAIGIVLSWVITHVLRQRALRADALMPAAVLGEAIAAALGDLDRAEDRVPHVLQHLRDSLTQLRTDLAPNALEAQGFIPPQRGNPFRQQSDRSAEYKQYLATRAADLGVHSVIVREGVNVAIARLNPTTASVVANSLQQLDALAQAPPALDATRAAVASIIAHMSATIAGVRPAVAAVAVPATPPSVVDLRVQLERLSGAMWLIWALLTWCVGVVTLLATNYGFGVGLDYFKCFFWGLGIQVAGQQLQQLAPTTITTTFNVTVPRP